MFNIDAWGPDIGPCEIEVFLTYLKSHSYSDWEIIFPLISRTAEHGPPENDEVCQLADPKLSDTLYEFITPGGVRVFWFAYENNIVICSFCSTPKSELALQHEIRKALWKQHQYFKETKNGSLN